MEVEPQLQPEPAAEVAGGVLENSHVVGVPVVHDDVDMAESNDGCCVAVLKRKRGRPAKGDRVLKTTTPPSRQKKEEEDVCFICFDGGSLVLCDRR